MAADRDRWLLPRLARIVAVEGYPRNSRQCADLVDELRRRCCEVGLVVIDIPDDVVHKRVANRRLCSVCGKPENDLARSSCCRCGGSIARRLDDRAGTLWRCLADYPEVSRRLMTAFAERLAVVGRLLRHGEPLGSGAAVLSNLIRFFTFEETPDFHVALFRAVWAAFSLSTGIAAEPGSFRFKTGIIGDGSIPEERYGTSWRFKSLHIDRDAPLFSHLHGPVDGFSGGELLLVDVVMRLRSLGISDVFESSQEPTGGGEQVLRVRKNRLDALPGGPADSTAADEADDLLAAAVSIPPSTNRSSCARRAKPGSERPERASFCG